MSLSKKPYYSFIHEQEGFNRSETFYEASTMEWPSKLDGKYLIVLNEISEFIRKNDSALLPYFANDLMNAPEKWKAFSFYFWGTRMNRSACDQCPETIRILKGIPDILSASVSILEPHSEIKAHYGDTDAIYRCHYGLIIPGTLPECGLRVGYDDRAWEAGKLLIFNDANYHRAWNHTDKRRIVLILDVLKPEYSSQKTWICSRVHGNIMWQKISEATGLFKGKKNFFTKGFSNFNSLIAWLRIHSLKRKSAWL